MPVSMHAAKKGSYLWVVCDLGVATPGNLARGRDNTEVGDVDLDAANMVRNGSPGGEGWMDRTYIVPLVRTPSWVYRGLLGFFLTPRIGSWTVTLRVGWVTLAFL